MSDNNVFVLDANVFIEASNRYYAFDIAPAFWAKLIEHAETGELASIDRVEQELARQKDDVYKWAAERFSHAFVSTDDDEIITAFKKIMSWVHSQPQFSDAGKARFANGADGWLIAYALTKGCVLVTHEKLAENAKASVKIPNVCQAFDVTFVDTFEMLRRLGIQFR